MQRVKETSTCRNRTALFPARRCGGADLFARSYTLAPWWPLDAFHLVMETVPDTCNLYNAASRSFCCRVGHDPLSDPERIVREALVSFLAGCERRRRQPGRACRAMDLGANNGWFSMYMLQMGAAVLAVEPQPDLAKALRETAQLNCWADRLTVVNARACAGGTIKHYDGRGRSYSYAGCVLPVVGCKALNGWRHGNAHGPALLHLQLCNQTLWPRSLLACLDASWSAGAAAAASSSSSSATSLLDKCDLPPAWQSLGLPAAIGGANLTELLVRAAGGVGGELTLLKMDADGALTLLLADDAQMMPAPLGWSCLQPECSSRGGFHSPLLA